MRILYLEGDRCSPKYVRGALAKLGFEVDVVLSEPMARDPSAYDACLCSDYPSDTMGEEGARSLRDAVEGGLGLVMVGGWTSFGRGGYARSPLVGVLPVTMQDGDDRVTLPTGAWLEPEGPHDILKGLPFAEPPVVTGFNDVTPVEGSRVVLRARGLRRGEDGRPTLEAKAAPVLVTAERESGRVAALAVDLAPHWSGGWTDWGTRMVDVGEGEEVGTGYLRFLAQLCAWASGKDVSDEARRAYARSVA